MARVYAIEAALGDRVVELMREDAAGLRWSSAMPGTTIKLVFDGVELLDPDAFWTSGDRVELVRPPRATKMRALVGTS